MVNKTVLKILIFVFSFVGLVQTMHRFLGRGHQSDNTSHANVSLLLSDCHLQTMERLLYLIKMNDWRLRSNPSAEDIRRKIYLIRISHHYLIELIMINFLLNLFTATVLDSLLSYEYSIASITIFNFIVIKSTNFATILLRSDLRSDDVP